MKKIISACLAVIALAAMCFLTGCDPEKPAGPGGDRMQPYDSSTGQYK